MPYTLNGIGTTYYGKRNLQQREGRCDSCNRDGVLSSYDTTLYFVFVFIPIIPLGKKRVLDFCAACSRHRTLTLPEWEQLKANSVSGAVEEYRADPKNLINLKNALGAHAALLDREGLRAFAPDVIHAHASNAEALTALGDAQAYLSEWSDAEQAYRRALAADSWYEHAREGLAHVLLQQNRPADAEEYLRHVADSGEPEKVGMLFALAETWQAAGEHRRALEAFDQCLALVPELRNQKAFKKARTQSEKLRDTNKPVGAKRRAARALANSSGGSDTGGKTARLVLPVLLVIGAIAWTVSSINIGRNREVVLVNGLSNAYEVSLNGAPPIQLPPIRRVAARVAEGTVRIEVSGSDYKFEPTTVQVKTNPFSRPFTNPVILINPDQTAMIAEKKIIYVAENAPEPEMPDDLEIIHTNATLHVFSSVHYPFQIAPENIKMSEGSKSVTRTQLEIVDTREPWTGSGNTMAAISQLADRDGKEGVIKLLRTRLSQDRDRGDLVNLLGAMSTPEEFKAFAEPLLAERPVRVNYHRSYQTLADRNGETTAIQKLYAELLAEDPDNPDLLYLAGRVTDDPDKSAELYRRAAAAPNPSGYAHLGLGYWELANGLFDEAYAHLSEGVRLLPDESSLQPYAVAAAIAARRLDDGLKLVDEGLKTDPLRVSLLQDCVYMHSLKGEQDKAEAVIQNVCLRVQQKYDTEASAIFRKLLQQECQFAVGKSAEVYKAWEQDPDNDNAQFMVRLLRDDVAGALAAAEEGEELDVSGCAIAAVACRRAGDQEKAARLVTLAAEQLEDAGSEERYYARALLGKSTLPPQKLARLTLLPEEKLPILLLLGELQSENRELYWTMARNLNYDLRGNHDLYKKYLAP